MGVHVCVSSLAVARESVTFFILLYRRSPNKNVSVYIPSVCFILSSLVWPLFSAASFCVMPRHGPHAPDLYLRHVTAVSFVLVCGKICTTFGV